MIADDERRRILERLAAGHISAERADELLAHAGAAEVPETSGSYAHRTAWLLSLDPNAGRSRSARRHGPREGEGGR
ncbi:MAG: hypothetical protein P8Y02_02780 [Deinococcales bacterium]|jgi:hypothetical protein